MFTNAIDRRFTLDVTLQIPSLSRLLLLVVNESHYFVGHLSTCQFEVYSYHPADELKE